MLLKNMNLPGLESFAHIEYYLKTYPEYFHSLISSEDVNVLKKKCLSRYCEIENINSDEEIEHTELLMEVMQHNAVVKYYDKSEETHANPTTETITILKEKTRKILIEKFEINTNNPGSLDFDSIYLFILYNHYKMLLSVLENDMSCK